MIALRKLDLFQFRNYEQGSFSFREKVVGISGRNGSGKTNLLDAIYYLCFTKSYFPRTDAQSVMKDHIGFRIAGAFFEKGENLDVACILRETGKKEFQVDQELVKRFSKHIGRIPCVMIAPDDVEIIQGSSEQRRKLIDSIISQMDPVYLQDLIDYNKILQQRNSLLKSDQVDFGLLDILDMQLAGKGNAIFEKRKNFSYQYLPLILDQYTMIAQQTDNIQIQYASKLEADSFADLLAKARQKDLVLQRTTVGIHRDDLNIWMEGAAFKNVASQGQRKSLLFAIKLAEFTILKNAKGVAPILLLDDVFEKLDGDRMSFLLQTVCNYEDCMLFISDTHGERLRDAFENLDIKYQLIAL
ncbi:MAG: DNA replication and repair protein RecF [Pseudopedobacter saltans]|uniref:DNA replication and repair protein RecF n=1 Tax=Pseudopedobacter saltans TaxID=151895 RepID=A0A2W5F9D4_9SPHI|nr:MAG: DNA replication and repair protein RecF [Pseudopedobacter saltans]